jgi:multiple sugar transport system substrate-binding protein
MKLLRGFAMASLVLAIGGCPRGVPDGVVVVDFWGMGREGEVVRALVPEFERQNPGIRVRVQQIPWTAAQEKLLTAFAGDAMPDVAQLGNTWVPQFQMLNAIEDLTERVAASQAVLEQDYFDGIWDTNVIGGRLYGVPWYVDTRLLFYRKDILEAAGHPEPPRTWDEWMQMMRDVKRVTGPGNYAALLPTNEWQHPIVLAMQAGSGILRENATRGDFTSPEFRRAFEFYVNIFREGLAPPVGAQHISNVYQEFARGYFAMYFTGPWNIGEFRRRLPPEMQDRWMTAPMPGPDGPESGLSLAGGASLVLFRSSRQKQAAWKLIEYLSDPETQARFYELTGNLPATVSTWDKVGLQDDRHAAAFYRQLQRVQPAPKLPEWERIVTRVFEYSEEVIQGGMRIDRALESLNRDIDAMLEKRRWMMERQRAEVPA